MKYFIDTEFLEGTQKGLFRETKPIIDLISIGIVAEDGREYYAISKDFNLKEAWNRWQQRTSQGDYNNINPKEYWIRENVLKPIFDDLMFMAAQDSNLSPQHHVFKGDGFTLRNFNYLIRRYGKSNTQIAKEIIEFTCEINVNNGSRPEFYGYYADYDWVVFCWLFGKMIDLPKGFPMYCIDLKQTLDEKAEPLGTFRQSIPFVPITGRKQENIMSKEQWIDAVKAHNNYPKQTYEHNALVDARWNYELYKFLNRL